MSGIGKAKQAMAGWWDGYVEAYDTFLTPFVHV